MVESFHDYKSKNESLLLDWEAFIDSGNAPINTAPYIQQSWTRSKENNIDAALSHSPVKMDDANTLFTLKENHFLLEQSIPYLNKLMDAMDTDRLVLSLANHKSEVLTTLSKNLTAAEKINLTPGSRWTEQDCGTNGIGTTLLEGKALSIFGHEHYSQSWHELICTSSYFRSFYE